VDLAGEALLSERALRLKRTRTLIDARAYHLARKLEDRDQQHTRRTDDQRRWSAEKCVDALVELLVDAHAPESAMMSFLVWAYDRAIRKAKRDGRGVRVPWDGPAGYYYSVARSLISAAVKAQWACEDANEKEFLHDRRRAQERKERQEHELHNRQRAQEDELRQAGHDSELPSPLLPSFPSWQEEQERGERLSSSQSNQSSITAWAEGLSEEESLRWL
jgi:hypothetical protein